MIWKIFTFHVLRLDDNVISLLLYGNDKFNDTKNKIILVSNIRFIENSFCLMTNVNDNLPPSLPR